MPASLPLVLLLAAEACPPAVPSLDADAFVRGLVGGQRKREDALSRYTYDVTEVKERLDGEGRVRRREIRVHEVFHVKGRPIRRLVARDGRPLEGGDREREERRARELAEAIRRGQAVSERPGVRLSRILERYHFTAVGRERVGARCTLVFDFAALSGHFDLDRDALLRKLKGRLWVDEAEHAVLRLDVRNTSGLHFALGLGATVSSLYFTMAFDRMEEGVWLPRRLEAYAEGRRLLFLRFRHRTTTTFSNFRRFEVDVREEIAP